MGTSPGPQRLIDPVLQTQTNVWELDRGGVWRVRSQGGGQGVSMAGQAWAAAGAELARAAGPQRRAAQGTPCPPPLGVCERGPRPNFLHFFDDNVFKENVNGH